MFLSRVNHISTHIVKYRDSLPWAVQQELSRCWDGRPFGHSRHGPKVGKGCCGGWVPI